ncbi:hypothetical protein K4A83_04960 [Spirulina subsalsa FACHB-351]|uniref:DUF1190 domain-containing protein n=1 Tax=Spirulina subsalsa FACHB-351 TaxID=234711 RepID=A0ABT3L356_9CYAN|nr:hypothetical protein [Spirulina subsalsa]MCW6035622.1 hypothetical protein [Spirulina subsalsa FACHB-351]
MRKILVLFLTLTLCWTTVACGSSTVSQNPSTNNAPPAASRSQLAGGEYPVQQAEYDDATGEYTLMVLNTPPGTPPIYRTTDLQMARLTDEEIQAGQKTYLKIDNDQAVLHLTEDFKIEYVHNVTETQTNPQTGQTETVIVRRESSFWTPFAGALAGQALGSLLFTPQYYVPPVYTGGVMTGYGGYGSSYNQAVNRYQQQNNAPPPAVKNRQTLRTTGNLRNNTTTGRNNPNANRSTGSGFGSSNLRSSGQSRPQTNRPANRSRNSFGSGTRRSVGGRRR